MNKKKTIRKYIEEYLSLYDSKRNQKLKTYWIEKPSGFGVNLFRPDEPK